MGGTAPDTTTEKQRCPQRKATISENVFIIYHEHQTSPEAYETQSADIIVTDPILQYDKEKRLQQQSKKAENLCSNGDCFWRNAAHE